VQVAAKLFEKNPGEHAMHFLLAEVFSDSNPSGHGVHANA